MPVYLSETTPKNLRGLFVAIIGPGYGIGLLVSLCVNIGFEEFDFGWRFAIGVNAVIGLVAVIGLIFLIHSPR